MKRYSILLLILALTLCITGCAKTKVDPQAEVTLHFVYGDKDIHTVLQQEEGEQSLQFWTETAMIPPLPESPPAASMRTFLCR